MYGFVLFCFALFCFVIFFIQVYKTFGKINPSEPAAVISLPVCKFVCFDCNISWWRIFWLWLKAKVYVVTRSAWWEYFLECFPSRSWSVIMLLASSQLCSMPGSYKDGLTKNIFFYQIVFGHLGSWNGTWEQMVWSQRNDAEREGFYKKVLHKHNHNHNHNHKHNHIYTQRYFSNGNNHYPLTSSWQIRWTCAMFANLLLVWQGMVRFPNSHVGWGTWLDMTLQPKSAKAKTSNVRHQQPCKRCQRDVWRQICCRLL